MIECCHGAVSPCCPLMRWCSGGLLLLEWVSKRWGCDRLVKAGICSSVLTSRFLCVSFQDLSCYLSLCPSWEWVNQVFFLLSAAEVNIWHQTLTLGQEIWFNWGNISLSFSWANLEKPFFARAHWTIVNFVVKAKTSFLLDCTKRAWHQLEIWINTLTCCTTSLLPSQHSKPWGTCCEI